jgi:hypothetical protein
MINVYFLSLNPEASALRQWDAGFMLDIFSDLDANIQEVSKIPNGDKAIVVIPARHHKGLEQQVRKQLDNLNSCVLFLLGDEEADFDIALVEHPKTHIWVQNPHMDKHDKYNRLGTGYPPHMKVDKLDKTLDVYFAGQVTHVRRRELTDILIDMSMGTHKVLCTRTKGFTQGEKPEVYYQHMSRAKIVPAPSGAVIPDSFRLFEALEAMAIPIADEVSPTETLNGYWDWLFMGDTPFPKIVEWDRLFGLVPEILEDWPRNMHQQTAWWTRYKRNFKNKILEQLNG